MDSKRDIFKLLLQVRIKCRERLNDSRRITLKNVKCGVKLKLQASTLTAGCELLLFHCCFVLLMCLSVSIFWLYLNHNQIFIVEKNGCGNFRCDCIPGCLLPYFWTRWWNGVQERSSPASVKKPSVSGLAGRWLPKGGWLMFVVEQVKKHWLRPFPL